jgi:hypothetical protein
LNHSASLICHLTKLSIHYTLSLSITNRQVECDNTQPALTNQLKRGERDG